MYITRHKLFFQPTGLVTTVAFSHAALLPKMWQSRELPSVGNISPQSGPLVDGLSHILIVDRETRIVAVPHVV